MPLSAAGSRIDAFLAGALPLSRSRIQALIDEARISLDDRHVSRSSERLRGGERVRVREPAPLPAELVAEDLPLDVLFEDADLLVVNKAAGMAVHPGAGNPRGTVANAVLFRCPDVAIGGELRPGIVHRLDKDTSGVLVVCKNDQALDIVARAFATRRVDKRYLAWCIGRPRDLAPGASFELVTGHRRSDGTDRRRFTTKDPAPSSGGTSPASPSHSRMAHSRFVITAWRDGISAVDVELLTGRTHQIRAHLADIGNPLVQDALYGGAHTDRRMKPSAVHDAVKALDRQALHAASIAFVHPTTGTHLRFIAPLPPDLALLDAAMRGEETPASLRSRGPTNVFARAVASPLQTPTPPTTRAAGAPRTDRAPRGTP